MIQNKKAPERGAKNWESLSPLRWKGKQDITFNGLPSRGAFYGKEADIQALVIRQRESRAKQVKKKKTMAKKGREKWFRKEREGPGK